MNDVVEIFAILTIVGVLAGDARKLRKLFPLNKNIVRPKIMQRNTSPMCVGIL